MDYTKVQTQVLRSPDFIAASNAEIGVWLRVSAYACHQECGGLLTGAMEWTDRVWLVGVGVSSSDVREAITAGLLIVEGSDLRVVGYDTRGEATLQTMRAQGRHGKKGGRPPKRSPQPTQTKTENPKGKPIGVTLPETPIPYHTSPDHTRPDDTSEDLFDVSPSSPPKKQTQITRNAVDLQFEIPQISRRGDNDQVWNRMLNRYGWDNVRLATQAILDEELAVAPEGRKTLVFPEPVLERIQKVLARQEAS